MRTLVMIGTGCGSFVTNVPTNRIILSLRYVLDRSDVPPLGSTLVDPHETIRWVGKKMRAYLDGRDGGVHDADAEVYIEFVCDLFQTSTLGDRHLYTGGRDRKDVRSLKLSELLSGSCDRFHDEEV